MINKWQLIGLARMERNNENLQNIRSNLSK